MKGAEFVLNSIRSGFPNLTDKHVNYSKVNSSQLNVMSESQMRAYGLLIVPGGNFIDIGNGLTPAPESLPHY
jgi:hypothetical protein